MNHKEFLDFLKEERACLPAIRWVKRYKYDLDSAWNNCHKVTWMLWILNKISFDKRDMVELACNIAEEIVNLTGEHKELCESVLRSARRYIRGFAKYHELHVKISKLERTYSTDPRAGKAHLCVQYALYASATYKQKTNVSSCYVYDSMHYMHRAINNSDSLYETKKTTKIQTSIIRSMIDSDDVLAAIEKYQNSKKRKRK